MKDFPSLFAHSIPSPSFLMQRVGYGISRDMSHPYNLPNMLNSFLMAHRNLEDKRIHRTTVFRSLTGEILPDMYAALAINNPSKPSNVCVFHIAPQRINATRKVALMTAKVNWWHDYCMKGEIWFIRGRLCFDDAKQPAPFPSAIVIFRGAQ